MMEQFKRIWLSLLFAFVCCLGYAQTVSEAEWWFDGQYAGAQRTPVSGSAWARDISTNSLNEGVHVLHIRLKDSNGNYSGISSGYFFKLNRSATANSMVEYWFDGDYDNRKQENILVEGLVNFQWPTNELEEGMHILSYRIGYVPGTLGGVHSDYFFKLNNGGAQGERRLTYWFDDNTSERVHKALGSGEELVPLDVDASKLTQGGHVLHLRIGYVNGVNMATTTDYFVTGSNPYGSPESGSGALTVTDYAYWFDNDTENGATHSYAAPSATKDFVADIPAATLPPGEEHTFNIRFNRNDGKSVLLKEAFTIAGDDAGSIVLDASITESNLVQLKWNSLADMDYYKVFRDGLYIGANKSSGHPIDILKVDNPKAGNYEYKVEAYSSIHQKTYPSNTVTITVDEANEDIRKAGSVKGSIKDEKGVFVEGVKLTFSHNKEVYMSPSGTYLVQGIPYGKSGSIKAEKEGYTIKPKYDGSDYAIKEEIPDYTIDFVAKKNNESDLTVKPQNNELELVSTIDKDFGPYLVDQGAMVINQPLRFKIDVKNMTKRAWSGDLLLMIEEVYPGKYDYSREDGVIARANVKKIEPDETQSIEFNLPKGINRPTMDCRLTLFSQQDYSYLNKKKVLGTSSCENPIQVNIRNTGEYEGVFRTVNGYMEDINKAFKGAQDFLDVLSYVKTVNEAAHWEDPENDIMSQALGDISGILTNAYKTLKPIDDLAKDVKTFTGYINELKELAKLYDKKGPVVFFALSKKIMEKGGGPLGKAWNVYFEVGEKALNAIKELEKAIYDNGLIYWDGGEIDIIVKHKNFWGLNSKFNPDALATQIVKVELYYDWGKTSRGHHMKLEKSSEQKREALTYRMVTIMDNAMSGGGYVETAQIKIYWANGRISWVPLNSIFTDPSYGGKQIEVTFKSETADYRHMADRLTLILP